ncbi:MAG: type II secretion system protein GspK [Gemmataceae bacterium]
MRLRSSVVRRRGVVLLAVLTIIVLLTLAAYKYNDWMLSEYRAADSSIRAAQARAFATSGVHYTAALLAANTADSSLGGNPYDNAGAFQGIAVGSSGGGGGRSGRFSVLTLPSPDDLSSGSAYRYGVTDEAGKINVNALLDYDGGKGEVGKKMLLALPNMTDDVASAILDWIDPDSTPRTGGAENETYSALNPPYRCKNGPLDSLEELLLVRGVTPQLLFGNDRNRNGIVDPDEDGGGGPVDLGWSAYLTVYSREVDLNDNRVPRISLMDSDLTSLQQQLVTALGEDMAQYIIAYRLYGGSSSGSGGSGGSSGARSGGSTTSTGTLAEAQAKIAEDLGKGGAGKGKIKSLWDLVDATVQITLPQQQQAQPQAPAGRGGRGRTQPQQPQQRTYTLQSPLKETSRRPELLPKLLDLCTVRAPDSVADLTPRININTAPQAVLAALKEAGGLTDGDVSSIVSRRPAASGTGSTDAVFRTPAWLMTELNLSKDTLKKVDKFITARTQVYRFQAVGYYDQGGPAARVEAVVDTNQGRPRVVYFRDLSELGRGFDLTGERR